MRNPGMRIRAAVPLDAARLLELKHTLDRETSFMLLETPERTEAAADVAAELEESSGYEATTPASAGSLRVVALTERRCAEIVDGALSSQQLNLDSGS